MGGGEGHGGGSQERRNFPQRPHLHPSSCFTAPPPRPRSPSGTSVGPLCAVLPWGTLPTNPEAPGPALRPREESSQQAHVYPSAHLVAQQRPLASSWAGVIY